MNTTLKNKADISLKNFSSFWKCFSKVSKSVLSSIKKILLTEPNNNYIEEAKEKTTLRYYSLKNHL